MTEVNRTNIIDAIDTLNRNLPQLVMFGDLLSADRTDNLTDEEIIRSAGEMIFRLAHDARTAADLVVTHCEALENGGAS